MRRQLGWGIASLVAIPLVDVSTLPTLIGGVGADLAPPELLAVGNPFVSVVYPRRIDLSRW